MTTMAPMMMTTMAPMTTMVPMMIGEEAVVEVAGPVADVNGDADGAEDGADLMLKLSGA